MKKQIVVIGKTYKYRKNALRAARQFIQRHMTNVSVRYHLWVETKSPTVFKVNGSAGMF